MCSGTPSRSCEGLGDSFLTLVLRAFIHDLDHRLATITDLHKAINHKFEEAGIVIAFPQRDLHLDMSQPLRINIEAAHPEEAEVAGISLPVRPFSRLKTGIWLLKTLYPGP